MRGLIIFDLDGTLYRGDAPYWHYAGAIARRLPAGQREEYLRQVRDHLEGRRRVAANDNWEAMVRLAAPYHADAALFQEAFLETRAFMLDADRCPLEVPQGLQAFLRAARGAVDLVLATNSPSAACFPLLDRLALRDAFDAVFPSANKPDGLAAVASARWHGPPDPRRTLSVGDHYPNDIAPAVARGWTTAYITPYGDDPGPSSVRGMTLEDVLPFLWDWVDSIAKEDDHGNS
ncbi:MAG: HAD family hydrolase [Firmicutes bacterium]|nr:HAD family hydrolase [Bacillota bacterium]